jgi:hypothetical protein
MLAYGEHECVVCRKAGTLRLNHVEIVPLRVGSWMPREECVWWILTCVSQREA